MSVVIQIGEILLLFLIIGNQIALRNDHVSLLAKLIKLESKLSNLESKLSNWDGD